jgi:hypothetical protein
VTSSIKDGELLHFAAIRTLLVIVISEKFKVIRTGAMLCMEQASTSTGQGAM